MFRHLRKMDSDSFLRLWLTTHVPVLVKKQMRNSKYNVIVEEGILTDYNPEYTATQGTDGRRLNNFMKAIGPKRR